MLQVGHVLVFRNPDVPECGWVEGRDVWWQDQVAQQSTDCPVAWVDAEHPLFLLYTSGSTGSPKGVLHTTGAPSCQALAPHPHLLASRPSPVAVHEVRLLGLLIMSGCTGPAWEGRAAHDWCGPPPTALAPHP